jgi:hypothetical protein
VTIVKRSALRGKVIAQGSMILEILHDHGQNCPKCSGFGYYYTGNYVEGSAIYAPRRQVVCDRCRAFGRIFFLTRQPFATEADYLSAIRHIVQETDCPS